MQTVNIHQAKTHFSRLIEQIQRGEEIVIAKAGVPVARLSPYVPERARIKPPGGMQGQGYWIADDFDAPLPEELLAAFQGRAA
ncbi:MAG: type II toxin-antitoxin system Phd/YefM family antitoxin [Thiobacillaceae bacterium]|nr:type II toxin-antitoxin system Phd/YefM family antitoxin [Thiobacillaceae bacterium]MCX7672118.1 type II toxin-antitoxin system Phd/YefM family antitoxin [Thiobacillaceae bacterium]MDW8324864.1 type II toxin-antitoxin system Phd/YefM family antitoxin [Burkholderiales bacterium]